jgi:regulator of sirC expression with transglutaminase-like and TPR domain
LDELADEYLLHYRERNAHRLAAFLFQSKGLKGVQSEYYHPRNSNLIHTIEEKEGLPISLACVYILVGARLGLVIEGCNVPGHFMAKIRMADQIVLVDCFNGGCIIDEKTYLSQQTTANHLLLAAQLPAESIVGRVLYNLINAYQHVKHMENARLMIELLNDLKYKLV